MSIADSIFDNVQAIAADGKFDKKDWVQVTGVAMKSAQTFGLPGPEKKIAVTQVVQRFISASDLSDSEKNVADTFVEFVLPLVIDGIKASARGIFKLVSRRCCF